jgi:cellulose synthase/poly-beta-1,6-N-acetylglucosamine synthase-like glycosyltransferase
VDTKASEGMSTGLNCTPCIYDFELQVSNPTALTLMTVSWFIPVFGRYLFCLELLDSVMTKKNLIKTWFSLNFLIIFFSVVTGYFLNKKIDLLSQI